MFGNFFHKKPQMETGKWVLLLALVVVFITLTQQPVSEDSGAAKLKYSAPKTTSTVSKNSFWQGKIIDLKGLSQKLFTAYGLYKNYQQNGSVTLPGLAGNSFLTMAKTVAVASQGVAQTNADMFKAEKCPMDVPSETCINGYKVDATTKNIQPADPLPEMAFTKTITDPVTGNTQVTTILAHPGDNVWQNLTADATYMNEVAIPAMNTQIQAVKDELVTVAPYLTDIKKEMIQIKGDLNWYYNQLISAGWTGPKVEGYPVLNAFMNNFNQSSSDQQSPYALIDSSALGALQSEAEELMKALQTTRGVAATGGFAYREDIVNSFMNALGDLRDVVKTLKESPASPVVDMVLTGLTQVVYPTMMWIDAHIHGGIGINFIDLSDDAVTAIGPITKVEQATDVAKGGFIDFFQRMVQLGALAEHDPENGSTQNNNPVNSYDEYVTMLTDVQAQFKTVSDNIPALAGTYDYLSETPVTEIPTMVKPRDQRAANGSINTDNMGVFYKTMANRMAYLSQTQTTQKTGQMHEAMGKALYEVSYLSKQMKSLGTKVAATQPTNRDQLQLYTESAAIASNVTTVLNAYMDESFLLLYKSYVEILKQLNQVAQQSTIVYVGNILGQAYYTGITEAANSFCQYYDCSSWQEVEEETPPTE